MKLILNRIWRASTFTVGELSIDNEYFCDTLEDTVRNLPEKCPNTPRGISCKCKEKVYANTAVPEGTYVVKLSHSSRFKRVMPELLSVPHFLGIRIHKGNKTADTEGCILVGTWDGKKHGEEKLAWVSNSTVAFDKLMELLQKATNNKEEITITIKNV